MAAWIVIIGNWIAAAGILLGLGKLAGGVWRDSLWIGYAAAITILQVLHLIVPIQWYVSLAIAGAGVLGWLLHRREWSMWRPAHWHWQHLLWELVFCTAALWLANLALSQQLDFDSGFYHLSSIRWSNEYSIVPGLANLHYRLGFNQTSFLFAAALNVYPLSVHGYNIANSLLMIGLLGWLTFGVVGGRSLQERLIAALLLPICILRCTPQRYSANLSSPSPDLPVFIFQIVVMVGLVRMVYAADREDRRRSLWLVIVVAAVGVTTKLSFAIFGIAAILMAVIWWWKQRENRAGMIVLSILMAVGTPLIAVWMVRGAILSGYPLFPSQAAALPVDYLVPAEIATQAELWVYAFARNPVGDRTATLSSWDWLPGWWARMAESFNRFLFVVPLYASLATLLLALTMSLRRDRDLRWLLLLVPPLAGALYWFFSAPDPRFAGAAFWLLALLPLLALARWAVLSKLLLVSAAMCLIILIASSITNFTVRTEFPMIPQQRLKSYQTRFGVTYWIADNPNNPLNLYNAPLPNSPYQHPDLQLRGVSLQDGFRMQH